jgi:general secretion pathway protein A
MYKNLFGFFGLPENPFTVNPNPRYMVLTPWAQEALAQISYGIRNRKGLMVLTGEAGTGKTTLIHSILDSLHQQGTPTAFIFNSRFKVSDLFALILAEFGIPSRSEPESSALEWIYSWLIDRSRAGKTPVLIVDEAQGLSKSVLEEIQRLLKFESTGEELLQIVLAGQPELEEILKRPQLHKLRERISCHCKTAPLSLEQTHRYIGERLRIAGTNGGEIFIREAIDAIHFYSQGIPRVVNLLCEHALINACAAGVRPVPMHMVEKVATEFQLGSIEPFSPAYISHGSLRAGLTSGLPTGLQPAIHSPTPSKTMLENSCLIAPPEGGPIALSSLNIPQGEGQPIAPIDKNVERACEVTEAVPTLSFLSTAKPETIPVPLASCVEAGSHKAHDLLPVSLGDEVAAPVEHTFHARKPRGREQCIRWARRMPILPAFRSFGGWLIHWRDQSLLLVRSIAWWRVAAFLSPWLREPISKSYWYRVKLLRFPHFSLRGRMPILPAFRSLGAWLSQWRDQCLPFFGSIPWRRLAAFLVLWLKKPVGTVHWCQVHPQGFLVARPLQRQSLPRK